MVDWLTLGGTNALTSFSTTVWIATLCMGQTYVREGRGANLPPHYSGSSSYTPPKAMALLTPEQRLAFVVDYLMLGALAVSFLTLTGLLLTSAGRFIYYNYIVT